MSNPLDSSIVIPVKVITRHTLVGCHSEKYPYKHGNCFSVDTEVGEFRILNFCYENIKKLIEIGIIDKNFKIIPLISKCALVHDERIPDNWYSDRFCECCTPYELLPPQQRLRHLRQIKRGERKEVDSSIFFYNSKSLKDLVI